MNKHRLSGRSTGLGLRLNPQSTSQPTAWVRNPKWAAAAAVVAALLVATAANASPIRFDNAPVGDPGHFVWYGGGVGESIGLEIISDAASQTGAINGIAQFHQMNALPANDFVSGGSEGGELQVGGAYGDSLLGVDFGTPIPSGLGWRDAGYIWYQGDPLYLPLGEETYLGIRFPLVEGGDWHYGWIGVVMERPVPDGPYILDAFAWGYETTPGVPIAAGIPEPGTLALLLLGAVGVLRRRG